MFRSFRSSSTTRSPSSLGGSESQSVSSLGSDGLRSSSNLSTTKRGVSNFELPTPHSSRNQQPATRLKSILKCTDSVPPTSTKTYESSDRSVHTHSSNMSSNSRRTNSGKSTVNGNNSNSQHTRKSVRRIHHHVGFNTVEVREYARTVGDNPSVSAGPPISYVPYISTLSLVLWLQLFLSPS
jgi:hypothetical protein